MEDEREDVYLFNCAVLRGTFPKKLWATEVLIVDGKNDEAKRMCEQVGMKTFTVIKQYESKSNPRYNVIVAEYRKHENDLFDLAMFRVIKTMMVYGYTDYEDFSKTTIEKILGAPAFYMN